MFVCNDMLQAKGQFKRRSTANNVEIIVPVPADADSPRFRVTSRLILSVCIKYVIIPHLQASHGFAKYHPEQSALVWSIKTFPVSVALRA